MNQPAPSRHPARRYVDPYAQRVRSIFGPAQTDAQLRARTRREAQAQIMPLLAQIEAEIKRRSNAEQSHLGAATADYARLAAQYAPQAAQIYGAAEQSQAGVDSALAQALRGGGTSLAAELASKLGAAGQNTAPAQVAAQTGQGAGNAQLATGSAELSRLLAHGTAAQEYGARLPSIAANTGLQRSQELAGQFADELSQRTGEVNAKLPALVEALLTSARSQQAQRARDIASYEGSLENRRLQAQIAQQSGLISQQRVGIEQQRANEDTRHHTVEEQQTARRLGISVDQLRERRREANVRAGQGHRRLDQSGARLQETKRHNRVQEKKKSKSSSAPPWATH